MGAWKLLKGARVYLLEPQTSRPGLSRPQERVQPGLRALRVPSGAPPRLLPCCSLLSLHPPHSLWLRPPLQPVVESTAVNSPRASRCEDSRP